MRLFANLVINDEWPRYLQSCLQRLRRQVDGIFVLSEVPIPPQETSRFYSCGVTALMVKPEEVPGFLEDEAAYREFGWQAMSKALNIKDGDWVLGIDADEFWVGLPARDLVQEAVDSNYQSIRVPIHEIFSINPISERVDGYWGGIASTRLTRYWAEKDQTWRRRGMACGVFPRYADEDRIWNEILEHYGRILHFGYANPQDREEKYLRYTGMRHNHSTAHVESIIGSMDLSKWMGEIPEVWRGVK